MHAQSKYGVQRSISALDAFPDTTHREHMTEIQLKNARQRLILGISNVGFWVIVSAAGVFWILSGGMAALQAADLLKVLCGAVGVQSLFDVAGGTFLMPPDDRATRRFFLPWVRGVITHSSLLCASGVLCYWNFKLTGGCCLAVLASTLALFFLRRHVLRFVANVRTHASSFAGCTVLAANSSDPSFTGETCGIGRSAEILIPDHWKAFLSDAQIQTVTQRRLWQIENNLPARALLASVCWSLTGCHAGALVLGLANRSPEQAVLLQCLWMTLWGFFGLLVLPSFSRASVFGADRAAAARGFDVEGWIHAFPSITGEDGNTKKLVQRVFYPIPSAEERLRGLTRETRLPILGNVARTNLFLSLATLTILGRCVHCNAGRPELWVFPPTD